MKESYENMKLLVENIQYEKYNWDICGDLKVTALLLGWQPGNSRERKHNIQKQWPKWESFTLWQKYVVNTALINPEKVF